MTGRIHLSPPDVGDAEEQAVVRALRSGWIAPLGPEVDAFEAELAARAGRRHAVALSSGTAALHLALLDLGVGPGEVVPTSTMTFAATANAIRYTGARPVFVDCDDTGNLAPHLLAEAIDDQRSRGRTVRVVLAVDLLGKMADYAALEKVTDDRGAALVSDAAESLGARQDGRPAGSRGVSAAVSFNGNKVMTTSGGGALLTDDAATADRARYLATQARQPVLHYEHVDVGYNYRLSNLLAALGRAQLTRLDAMIERRRRLRQTYRRLVDGVPGVQVFGSPDGSAEDGPTRDNFWLTSLLVDAEVTGWRPADLIAALAAADIEARPLWKPMHAQPVHAGEAAYLDGTADLLFAQGLSLPSGSAMTPAQQDHVLDVVGTFLTARGAAR